MAGDVPATEMTAPTTTHPHSAVATPVRPDKPHDTPFYQQRLPHFYAQHNPPSTIVCLFLVAVSFIPIGAAIIVASDSVFEMNIRYDHVNQYSPTTCNHSLVSVSQGSLSTSFGCRARRTFTLTDKVAAPIFIYYRLTNFYQNYRAYAKSFSDDQVQGVDVKRENIGDCWPFASPGEYSGNVAPVVTVNGVTNLSYASMVYSPCGAVAWSMFNDTIGLWRVPNASVVAALTNAQSMSAIAGASLICDGGAFAANGTYTGAGASLCTKKGIALGADTETRHKAPFRAAQVWTGLGMPAGQSTSNDFHAAGWYAGEVGHKIPSAEDEDFMVWARISGLSDFSKLYRRIDVDLPAGTYALDIIEHFASAAFEGEKHVILATSSWIGGKNYVLGGLFVAFGCLACVQAVGFLVWYVLHHTGHTPTPTPVPAQ